MSALPQKALQSLPFITRARRTKHNAALTFQRRPVSDQRVLRAVESDSTRRARVSGAEITRRLSLLSVEDVMRVNHATIREGESHRVWPPYIFEKFRQADVIRENSAEHYVLRDANLTRIA